MFIIELSRLLRVKRGISLVSSAINNARQRALQKRDWRRPTKTRALRVKRRRFDLQICGRVNHGRFALCMLRNGCRESYKFMAGFETQRPKMHNNKFDSGSFRGKNSLYRSCALSALRSRATGNALEWQTLHCAYCARAYFSSPINTPS